VRLRTTLADLARRYGGETHGDARAPIGRFVPLEAAGAGDLAPLLARRFAKTALAAAGRGAVLLVDQHLRAQADVRDCGLVGAWFHPHAAWAMAKVLDELADAPETPASFGQGFRRGEQVVLHPRVVLGAGVHVGASSVIGAPGFGWVTDPQGRVTQVPHKGGVIVEDDVYIGALCTIDAGVLGPTILRRGVRIDSQVHIGHNCDIGEGTMIAAQSGLAGSVRIGRGVLLGGQAGIADHVSIGDGARVAAKSGVIGDVPSGAVVAGYPAVPRVRWLRMLARMGRSRRDKDPR
jgi:UDP-3-O-[3-hydroxymyristoyl] glucosamine N-acyltransferase